MSAAAGEIAVRPGRRAPGADGGRRGRRRALADERLTLTAKARRGGLEGRDMQAHGGVKTELRPPARGRGGRGRSCPGLLAQEQPVNVNADAPRPPGAAVGACRIPAMRCSGRGRPPCAPTRITIDRAEGNLAASGAARLSLPLSDGPRQRPRARRFGSTIRRARSRLATPADAGGGPPWRGARGAGGCRRGPAAQVVFERARRGGARGPIAMVLAARAARRPTDGGATATSRCGSAPSGGQRAVDWPMCARTSATSCRDGSRTGERRRGVPCNDRQDADILQIDR